MDKLKPCPFCGGDEFEKIYDYSDIQGYTNACFSCIKCSAQSRYYYTGSPVDKATVIRKWNTRPAEDALTAEVERLKNDLAIQKNLTNQACFEANRAYDEVEKWKQMFYDLVDNKSSVSTDTKVFVIENDPAESNTEREE